MSFDYLIADSRYHDSSDSTFKIGKVYNTVKIAFFSTVVKKNLCFFSCYLYVTNIIKTLLKRKETTSEKLGVERDFPTNKVLSAISRYLLSAITLSAICYHPSKNWDF